MGRGEVHGKKMPTLENNSMKRLSIISFALLLLSISSTTKADEFSQVVRVQCTPEIELFTFEIFGLWNTGMYPDTEFTNQVALDRKIYEWSLAALRTFECQFRGTELSVSLYCRRFQDGSVTHVQGPYCHYDIAFIEIVAAV